MIRRVAAVVLALTLTPALVRAQETVLTVAVPSADVYKGPSTGTPVIGHVPRGTVLPVSRNLGSWIRVDWPDAADGVGYVHITKGRLTPARTSAMSSPAASAPSPSTATPAPATSIPPPAARKPPRARMAVHDQLTGAPISHTFGVGGLVGSRRSFGATARAWRTDHIGIQLAFTREARTSDVAAGRVTSIQFEPGAVFGLFDHVSDYLWIRPYVGSALSFHHQTFKDSPPAAGNLASDNGVGFRIFGGGELTFANVPRFGLSAELGYRHVPAPFPGFEPGRLGASIAGHWYVK